MQNGVTALHRAAIDGHADVARALLDGGCSMDKKDEVIIVAKDPQQGWRCRIRFIFIECCNTA